MAGGRMLYEMGALAAIATVGLVLLDRWEDSPRLEVQVLSDDPMENGTLGGFKQQGWSRTRGETYLRVHVKNTSKQPNTVVGVFLRQGTGEDRMTGPSNLVLEQNERTGYSHPWKLIALDQSPTVVVRSLKAKPIERKVPVK